MDKTLETILKRLKKIPFCEGIVFSGSRLEGRHSPNSDYDFTVLISKGKSYYRIWRLEGYIVDICAATAKVIAEKDLTNERIANPELYILSHGKILYDRFGNLEKIQTKAKKVWSRGPKNLSKKDIAEIGYVLKALSDDIKSASGSSIPPHFLLNETLKRLGTMFFELYGEWQPRARGVESAMKKMDTSFFRLYRKASSRPTPKTVLKLVLYLVRKFGLPQTGEIYYTKD
jgi:predicted nucleotidyltransferase